MAGDDHSNERVARVFRSRRCVKVAVIHAVGVGIGGFLGALARYGLSGLVHRFGATSGFPYGTLAVNLLGCLLIGLFAGLMEGRHMFAPEVRVFAMIGVLGGFTTFSTFGYENFMLMRDAQYLQVAANIGIHVIAGLALVWLGYTVTTLEMR
jgi:fluoride exporter